jgi:hypothetical protein
MKTIKPKEKNLESGSWISPAKSLSQHEFLSGIHKAEEGPFHTVQESMENFELWMKSREKK